MLRDLDWLTKHEALAPLQITKDKILEEGAFGKFIRLYLGEHLGQNNSGKFQDSCRLGGLTCDGFFCTGT